MPKFNFGEKTNVDSSRTDYIELKNKGDKVHVRFLGGGVYEGKHFLKSEDGKFVVSFCPRIMNKESCQFCEKFFEAKKELKEIEALEKDNQLSQDDKKRKESAQATIKQNNPAVFFYYPVLDRDNEEARLFKTKPSTRWKLEEEYNNGIDITNFDYIVTRTEKPGTDYYTITRLDSSTTKPLTDKEKEEVKKVEEWDIDEMVYGTVKSSFDPSEVE